MKHSDTMKTVNDTLTKKYGQYYTPKEAELEMYVLSTVTFTFYSNSLADATNLKDALMETKQYQLKAITALEESLYMVQGETFDSLYIQNSENDANLKLLSKNLCAIGDKFNGELTGFAHQ